MNKKSGVEYLSYQIFAISWKKKLVVSKNVYTTSFYLQEQALNVECLFCTKTCFWSPFWYIWKNV